MNILVSNDDGINSKALAVLTEKLSSIADVYVIAPDSERSGNSHHINLSGKIRIEEKSLKGAKQAYALWGTPSDCVHAGIRYLFKDKIDLVVSGINLGPNLSSDITYSGTAAAAREAFIYGIPSIALSICTFNKDIEFDDAADIGLEVVKKYMSDEDKDKYFLNINIPYIPRAKMKGYMVTKTSATMRYGESYKEIQEFGVRYIDFKFLELQSKSPDDLEVDVTAINNGYISVSPLDNNNLCREHYKGVKEKWQK